VRLETDNALNNRIGAGIVGYLAADTEYRRADPSNCRVLPFRARPVALA
jgi:hypothetical protein